MHFEDFSAGGSLLHRMNPAVKIVSLTLFAAVVAVGGSAHALLAALGFSVFLVGLSNVDLEKVFQRLVVVNAFIVFLWAVLPFTTPGEPAFRLGFLTATREGLHLSLLITLKANAIILATIALIGTSPVFSLVHSLAHLRLPDKLIHLFFFCYRYISVLHMEYTKLRNAMKIRCFKPHTDTHTYRSYAYLLGMLFVKSYDRSERIYNAMVCRGFKGKFHTLHHHHDITPADAVSFILMSLFTAGIAYWEFSVR